jgi:hypothetical protein
MDCRPYFVDSGAPGRGPLLGVVRADPPADQTAYLSFRRSKLSGGGGFYPHQRARRPHDMDSIWAYC